jgi:hypothetical protein
VPPALDLFPGGSLCGRGEEESTPGRGRVALGRGEEEWPRGEGESRESLGSASVFVLFDNLCQSCTN